MSAMDSSALKIVALSAMEGGYHRAMVEERADSNLKKRHRGFTWIELVMVLAVMGILALMAIPAMQEGTLRKQVKEGLALADVAKAGVQAAWSVAGEMPADNKAAGLPEPEKIVGTRVSADRGATNGQFSSGICGRPGRTARRPLQAESSRAFADSAGV